MNLREGRYDRVALSGITRDANIVHVVPVCMLITREREMESKGVIAEQQSALTLNYLYHAFPTFIYLQMRNLTG